MKPVSEEQEANAAVALLLKIMNQDINILFVKRIEPSDDPWSGHIAFPGGKWSVKDQNLKQTIIREIFEETHIDLDDCCRFIGVMTATGSTLIEKLKILPFVILVEQNPTIEINKRELEWYGWISMEELIQHKKSVKNSFGEFPAYAIDDIVIWGLTYRILEGLIRILEHY